MIDFNARYTYDNALNFLRDYFLPEDFLIFEEEVIVSPSDSRKIEKVFLLGETRSLGLKVYEFTHKSESDPRVTITKEAFKFLADRGEQRALVFFVSENSPNYRFSLITIDLKPDGKKISKIISNPRRYSYYLGPDAKINTPTKYLIGKGRIIDFEDLKSRFSVEVVNKEFFKQISKYFMILAGGKQEREDFKEGALKLPSIDDHQKKQEFVVRLIGRIIFCWFLKKKNSVQGKPLMPEELLSTANIGKNYYHNVLEPLFFEVLNKPLKERNQKFRNNLFDLIPFLNGGLFEAHIDDYYELDSELKISKYVNTLQIPDNWFKNLFETLETYNFTIDENTSSDIELSVDPEMLGRIFENLLAEINPDTGETARKSTGSYYTPRDIVDYMVSQSLKYYLLEKTKISEEEIDQLIHNTFDNIKLSDPNKTDIIDALSFLKVIDPACGSGAFPMGILQKTVSILSEVDPNSELWMEKQIERIEDSILRNKLKQSLSKENVNFIHKLGLIKNAIYGVDIQEIAVELSKLRVFLSLIVDAYVDDEKENRGLVPLPNLEFKFVCANSLIDLPPEKFYLVDKEVGYLGKLPIELKKLRNDYFNSYSEEKEHIKNEFKEKQKQLFDIFLEWDKNRADKKSFMLSEWDPFSDKPSSWFNPDWMFGVSEGFDIVIANPPYVRQEKIKEQKESLQEQNYEVFNSSSDIYTYFYEKGYKLLKDNGILVFITSNKWMRAKYGEKLRKFIKENTKVLEIIDFGGYKVFDATVDTNILIFKALKNKKYDLKEANKKDINIKYKENSFKGVSIKEDFDKSDDNIFYYVRNNFLDLKQDKLNERAFLIADNSTLSLKEKIEKIGTPLKDWDVKIYRGVLTGFNEAFIITTEKRNEILANCKTSEERKRTEDIIKPILRGRDIGRYYYKWAGLWVIFIPWHFPLYEDSNIQGASKKAEREFEIQYPNVYIHLLRFKDELLKRNKDETGIRYEWYALQRCAATYYPEFEKEKIVWQEIVREPSFTYDTNKMYCEATTFLMTGKSLKYLIAILNSKPATFFFKQFYAGGGLGESGYRYKKAFLEQLPIPPITPKNQHIVKEIEYLVNQIIQYYRNTDKCSCNTDIPVCEDVDQDIPVCEDEDKGILTCEDQSTSTANRNTDKCSCNTDIPVCEDGDQDIPVCEDGDQDIPVCENIGQNIPICRENYEYSKENLHITNRNLPHWTKSGAIYWITFRLADSLPHQKLEMWRAERDSWLKKHPKPWSEDDTEEYNEKFNERLEKWLDSGYGSCILTNPAIRKEVIESILKFDGERLKVHSAVIMPNHVHLLLEPFTGYSLSEILKGIKGASAQKVNKFLETKANKIWMEESYDHIVRNEKEYFYFIRYIVNNPIRANLPSDKYWLYISNNITQTFPQIVTQAFLPVDNKYTQTSIAQTGMSMLPQEYEHQIDQLVYKLYGLTDEEIRLIEEGVAK